MNTLEQFAASLEKLSDEALIDERQASLLAHRSSALGERDLALQKTFVTEHAMIRRFGLGEAFKRLAAKYPQV